MDYILDRVLALKEARIFKELSGHTLTNVAMILEKKLIAPDEVIMRKGDTGDSMYLIESGKLEVRDGDRVLATLGQKEVVGEMSLLAPIDRTADVVAVEESTLFRIEREKFIDLVYEEPEIMHGIIKSLVYRISEQNKKLTNQ